jgi:hypothetical protein
MSEGIQIAALHRTEMARELAMLRAAVSSATEFMLGHSPNKTFQVEVVGELVVEFWKQEEQCSCLERYGMRVRDLLLGSPFGRAQLAD